MLIHLSDTNGIRGNPGVGPKDECAYSSAPKVDHGVLIWGETSRGTSAT
jgi:hypothetical protein